MTKPAVTVLLLAGLLGGSLAAHAQHVPLIERMADSTPGSSAAAPAAIPATVDSSPATVVSSSNDSTAPTARAQIGDTTRSLLRMQADGSHAGKALPMLGEPASRSYQRYLNSFDHPIPEYFETTVPTSSNAGSSR